MYTTHYLVSLVAAVAFHTHAAVDRAEVVLSGAAIEDGESFSRAKVSGFSGVELPIFGGPPRSPGKMSLSGYPVNDWPNPASVALGSAHLRRFSDSICCRNWRPYPAK